jgi:hypothetical protein
MREKKALILIPCSREKEVLPANYHCDPAIDGIETLRIGLRKKLKKTPRLASSPGNQDGLLKDNARKTPARFIYIGTIFQSLRGLWDTRAANILIVSAAYGLVKPKEAVKQYELEIGDRFSDGQTVKDYWIQSGLPKMLEKYIRKNHISHVWSLLPNSNTPESRTPYHGVFHTYWTSPRNRECCFWVEVFKANNNKAAGRGSTAKRGEWLAEVLRHRPGLLTQDSPSKTKFNRIPGFRFEYRRLKV